MGNRSPEAPTGVAALVFMKLESERVPRKNLRDVGGKPLFWWIFSALASARSIERVVLNTDSSVIADAVTSYFDVTIHMRPDHLLTIDRDEANQIMAHDLRLTSGEFFLQTHSTNPLLTSTTIDRAVDVFFNKALPSGHDSVFTVTNHRKRFFYPNGRPVNHDPMSLEKTQALEPLLEENSCAYVFSRSSFEENGQNRIGSNPFMMEIAAAEALDIDEEADLILADRLLSSDSRDPR